MVARIGGRENTSAEGEEVWIKQGQTRSGAIRCNHRNIIRTWAQTFILTRANQRYRKTWIMAAAPFLLASKTARERKTKFPHTNAAGTRGEYHCDLPLVGNSETALHLMVSGFSHWSCQRNDGIPSSVGVSDHATYHTVARLGCLMFRDLITSSDLSWLSTYRSFF